LSALLIKLAQLFEVSLDDFGFRDIEKEGTISAVVKPTSEDGCANGASGSDGKGCSDAGGED